jgi:hypothetical protein
VAARLIIEGRARLATTEETKTYQEEQEQARLKAEAATSAQRMHVTIVNPHDLPTPKAHKTSKE